MELRYSLYWNSTGYSVAAQELILALLSYKPDIKIKIHAINGFRKHSGISEARYNLFSQLHKNTVSSDCVSVQHCIPRIYMSDKARKRIGFAVYETIDPPLEWVRKMNEMDAIITASSFNANTFKKSGVNKEIYVIPHCFDINMFHKDVVPKGRYNLFTFMYIATYRDRKNHKSLIKAFFDAFSMRDKVCLILKTNKPDQLKAIVDNIKRENWKTKDTAPVFVDGEDIPFEDIPKYMKQADVYVSPSLGEGFCYPCLHAMALGIPVITTRYGGVLEFAKPELCTYFEPSGYKTIPTMDGFPQFKNKIWPEIKVSEIRDKLLFAFNSYSVLKELSQKSYDYVRLHYNCGIIGRKIYSSVVLF